MSPPPDRAAARRRKSRRQGWVPNQHGAWAMVLTPPVVGAIESGPTWRHLLLLVAWLVGYFAFFAAGLWLRSGRKARYVRPVQVYGAATVVLLAALLVASPGLVAWAPWYAVLLVGSLVASLRRADRSWFNDTVTVAAACLTAPVAAGLGTHPPTTAVTWTSAAVLFAYFFGTVVYVKTMIRERGRRSVLVASVAYHVVVAVVAWWVHPVLGVVATALAARAWLVPALRPQTSPKAVGLGEIAATLAVATAVLVAVA